MNSVYSDRNLLLMALLLVSVVHLFMISVSNKKSLTTIKQSTSIDITFINTPPAKKEPVNTASSLENPAENKEEKAKKIAPPPVINNEKANSPKIIAKKNTELIKPKKQVTEKPAESKIETTEHKPLSLDTLQQQISQLGSEISFKQLNQDNNELKFANMASAHKFIASQYLKDWDNKVERTGNLNYPKVATQKGFYSSLTMDVGLRSDGSIYSINISKSSDNKVLDEAAKKIVKMSAPFAPLPLDLLKELKLKQQDILVITRVWIFSDESGMTAK